MHQKKVSWSFKHFFLIVIVSSVLVHVILMDVMILNQLETQMIKSIESENTMITNVLGDKLAQFFSEPVEDLETISNAMVLHKSDGGQFSHALDLLNKNHAFSRISLVDENEKIIKTWPEEPYYDHLDMSRKGYLEQVSLKKGFFWSNTYFESLTGNNVIDLVIPYEKGYLIGTISLSKVQAYIAQLNLKEGATITVVDESGSYLAHSTPEKVIQRMKDPYVLSNQFQSQKTKDIVVDGNDMYAFSIPVKGTEWTIVAYYSKSSYSKPVRVLFENMLFTQIISVFVTIALLALGGLYFQQQINHILAFTKKIAEGDYTFKSPDTIFADFSALMKRFEVMANEIGGREEEIVMLNNTLEDRILERTQQLSVANEQLEKALVSLEETQFQLVQKEKMASLGVLVAGIAHEVNTPIGVCLTTSTFLTQQADFVREKYENEVLKKSELEDLFNHLDEAGMILYHNLQKAAELIGTFKQISQYQVPYDMEYVNLKGYIRSVLNEISERYETCALSVNIEDENLELLCYPTDLELILKNMVSNAMIHGLEGIDNPKIEIVVHDKNDEVVIAIVDNGRGIDEENMSKVFDPFFTTRRGNGGTGLGLHIIYNLITQRYNGIIECASQLGVGTSFTIRFPKQI